MCVSRDRTAGFAVYQRNLHFDAVRVWTMTFQPMVFQRTATLISQSDPETYRVGLLLSGAMQRSWGRQEANYGKYELHADDSSQPFELRVRSTHGPISCVGIEIPKKQVTLPRGRADRLIGRPVSARNGIGALLAGALLHLTTDTSVYRPTDDSRLGAILGDLVSALFAHVMEEDDRGLPPETRRRTLALRIQQFIRQHLHDPQLTRDTIAAAHHISTSYLHRLFQDDGIPVMAWVRHQRLERARNDLALHAMPVHEIAARWGFTCHTDFTRAFRTAYGTPPRDYRQQKLHTQPTRPSVSRNSGAKTSA
ncbi:helix-turn-helix transcriptional regulator [Saccharopolyspora sp. 5N708]|uniref:helix-turn-helix transcriptional regulator n=1 Tax=Saccharopolyspora sp. 5N708 TaxID=3457424 RepID=UPI003FD209C6